MGKRKKWEPVSYRDIAVGDVIRRTSTLTDGTVGTLTGSVRYKDLAKASTLAGLVLAQSKDGDAVTERRVVKPKLPVKPGTVIDAVVERSWRLSGPAERRSIRLIRGGARWVGMEHGSGSQFIADDADIKKWTLVAEAKA